MTVFRAGPVWLVLLAFLQAFRLGAAASAVDRASELEIQGSFKDAAAVLQAALDQAPTNSPQRALLRFELDRLERIRKDFPLTEEGLFTQLQKSVKDMTRDEFTSWMNEGRFDSRQIDGERRFMASSISNLFFRYPTLNSRRLPPKDNAGLSQRHLQVAREIRQAAQSTGKPYVLPKRFRATMTVTLRADAASDGEVVRAWLPVPRRYPFQMEIEFLRSSPQPRQMASELSPIRSVFMEQPARNGQPTVFSVEYAYTAYGVRFETDPADMKLPDAAESQLKPFLTEGPHIVFTPEMRALSEKILQGEKSPGLQARKFYDWIAENILYSYAIEYSTIRNISDDCRQKGYGDCGQEALLLITLCRLNRIPARWQSGWSTFPGAKTIHDWTEIYLAPHGWMPVDPYMGIFAMRYATGLTPEQQTELRDFYFCGLDQHRMIANSDHSQDLSPSKKSPRSDTVDFQRGELESSERNFYFDEFSYSLDINEVELKPASRP